MAIIGIGLLACLQLAGTRSRMIARSQAWNACMPILEAGIEEGLTHCTFNNINRMTTCGWSLSGGAYVLTNKLGDGYFVTRISPINTNNYEIVSTGFHRLPGQTNYVARTVRVTAEFKGAYFATFVVRKNVDLKGNNLYTDSYDSTDPAKSTNGAYDPAKRGDGGDIACTEGLTDSLNVGNADVFGHVLTGPLATVAKKAGGVVGSLGWHSAGNTGIEPGWWVEDLNINLAPAGTPFTNGFAPPSGKIDTTISVNTVTDKNGNIVSTDTTTNTQLILGNTTKSDSTKTITTTDDRGTKNKADDLTISSEVTITSAVYDYILDDGEFVISQLRKNVLVMGDASLYVTDSIGFSGSESIKIISGASLKIYTAGSDSVFNDILNENISPLSFQYFGLPSNVTLTLKGDPNGWSGVVYAPNAAFKLSGQGKLHGSIVAFSAQLSGNAAFHYDQALGKVSPARGYVVTSWTEL
jgi:hypothetical protein